MESAQLIDQVKAMYLQGLTRKKIAQKLDIDYQKAGYILYTLLRIHVSNPRKYFDDAILKSVSANQLQRIFILASFGYTAGEIAEDQQISPKKVAKLVKVGESKSLFQKKV